VIKYALHCAAGHEFEGWFGSSSDFDDQAERGLVACPVCGDAHVAKQIMAPAVTGARKADPAPSAKLREMMLEAAEQVRAHVEENFDYMGDAFADEARAIHEGRSEARGIYGEATPKEIQGLEKDGVSVAPMPPAPIDRRKLS
jgi:hypothetical protein